MFIHSLHSLGLALKFEKHILNSIKPIIFTYVVVFRAGFGENLNFSMVEIFHVLFLVL
jgi:hypothetical protein